MRYTVVGLVVVSIVALLCAAGCAEDEPTSSENESTNRDAPLPRHAAPATRAASDHAGPDALVVPHEFSVSVPEDGFHWKKLSDFGPGGIGGQVYGCTKEGDPSVITLSVAPRVPPERRSAALSQQYEALMDAFGVTGYTEVTASPPELRPPIPMRVSFDASGIHERTGRRKAKHYITVFKSRTYLFQASADDPDRAEQLASVADTLREPGD